MALEEVNWDEYYQKIQGRAPRQLLLDALEKFPLGESLQPFDPCRFAIHGKDFPAA